MRKKKEIRAALVGTDSLRGKEIKDLLDGKKYHLDRVDFYDPEVKEAYSKLTEFRGEARVILPLEKGSLAGYDVVFLAADKKTNRECAALAAGEKFLAVDLSEAFSLEERVPVVVSGVNHRILLEERPLVVSNPHPVTIILTHIFSALEREFNLRNAVAFVLQPVSAFDVPGVEELADQSVADLSSSSVTQKIFKTQIAFNLLSHTENMDEDGFSVSEKRILSEVKRVLSVLDFPLSLSIVQAPVFHTYAVMIHLTLDRESDIASLESLFKESAYFNVTSPSEKCPVSSALVAGKEEIFIGLIKREEASPNRFWIWTVTDNLTRGSALNALEILEHSQLISGA